MPIELDETRDNFPSIKLREVGDSVTVAVADKVVVPWLEFGTDRPKIGNDGKRRTQERVAVIVIEGHGAVYVENERDQLVRPGMEATIYLAGHHRWERVEAYRRDLDGRPVRVGDVWRWTFDRTERSTVAGLNDKRVRTLQVRDPRPDEAEQTAACEAFYWRMHPSQGIDLGGAPAAVYGDEDPF